MNTFKSLNFLQKIELIDQHWSPRVIAEMNDYQFKVVKLLGISYGTITSTPTKPSSSSKGNCASTFATAMC